MCFDRKLTKLTCSIDERLYLFTNNGNNHHKSFISNLQDYTKEKQFFTDLKRKFDRELFIINSQQQKTQLMLKQAEREYLNYDQQATEKAQTHRKICAQTTMDIENCRNLIGQLEKQLQATKLRLQQAERMQTQHRITWQIEMTKNSLKSSEINDRIVAAQEKMAKFKHCPSGDEFKSKMNEINKIMQTKYNELIKY